MIDNELNSDKQQVQMLIGMLICNVAEIFFESLTFNRQEAFPDSIFKDFLFCCGLVLPRGRSEILQYTFFDNSLQCLPFKYFPWTVMGHGLFLDMQNLSKIFRPLSDNKQNLMIMKDMK